LARTISRAKRRKGNGKAISHSFVMFQHRMLEHPAFLSLSGRACKALLFLAKQYTGYNNGDLCIAWKVAKGLGLKSNGNLRLATKELCDAGFVVQTRQGGRNQCSLFALAWFPIDECDGKLDVPSTSVAPNEWLFKNRNSEPPGVQCEPPGVQSPPFNGQRAAH
jgi:hypothetical protein